MIRAITTLLLGMILLVFLLMGIQSGAWNSWRPEEVYPLAAVGFALLALLIVMTPRLLSSWRARGKQGVLDPVQVEELVMTASPLVLDLRDREAYKGKLGHIRGSLNMPYANVGNHFEELRTKEPRPIIIMDNGDKRSYEIAAFLGQKGFDWIYVMKGGIKAWKRDRLPLYH